MSDTPKTDVVKDRYSMVVEACEEYRAQLDLYRSKIENLEAENAALEAGVESALNALSVCFHERWDECLIERAYHALQAINASRKANP